MTQKRYITSDDRCMIPELRRESYDTYCSEVPKHYIHYAFNTFKKGIVYVHDDAIQAFCIWKTTQRFGILGIYKTLEILLVCSKRQESKMLNQILFDVEAYCRENGINNIILQPENDEVKEYYKKHGFVEDVYNPGGYLVKLVLTPIVIHPFKSDDAKRRTRRKHPLLKSTNRRRTLSVANRAEAYALSVENIDYGSDSDEE